MQRLYLQGPGARLPIMAAQRSPPQPAHATNQPSSGNNSDDDDFSWIATKDMLTLEEMSDEPGLRAHDAVARQHIKTLPRGTRPVRFVGEGAANAVFEFRVPEASRLAPDFKGWHPPFPEPARPVFF